jgi:hypothetical protein
MKKKVYTLIQMKRKSNELILNPEYNTEKLINLVAKEFNELLDSELFYNDLYQEGNKQRLQYLRLVIKERAIRVKSPQEARILRQKINLFRKKYKKEIGKKYIEYFRPPNFIDYIYAKIGYAYNKLTDDQIALLLYEGLKSGKIKI